MAITKVSPGLLDLDAGITISVADNSDNLTLTSTDADANSGPNLRMYRNSGSPADSDAIALIDFEGRNDNSQDVVYAAIDTRIVDASDGTEDGRIELATILAGTAGTSRILMDATETAFNDNSKDLDFRVESDTITHALFVDGALGNVGIGAVPKITEAGWTNLSVGGMGALINSTAATAGGRTQLSNNVYTDESGNYSFISTDEASLYKQIDGTHSWLSAASGSADAHMTMLTRMSISLGGDATHYGALNVNTTAGDGSEARFNVNPGGAGDNCTVAIKQDDASTVGVYLQGDGASWFTGGINPGSGATTAALVLDDYEEGTWTPTIISSGQTPNYATSVASGTYTKIGNVVNASFLIVVTGVTDNGSNGNKSVDGLPFSQTGSTYAQVGLIGYNDVFGDDVGTFYATGGNLTIIPAGVSQSNYTGVITTGYFGGTITYRVA